jgi:hypothetical protein
MTLLPLQAPVQNPDVAMALAVAAGFGFGFVLERAGFGDARKLVRQFFGTEMIMLKVMFSAVATAVLLTSLLDGVGLVDLRALGDLVTSDTWLWPMAAGGILIGAGIVFSGYCPGTSFVGIASGKLDALLAYGGVIVGRTIAAELEARGPLKAFWASGAKGHLYLYDVLRVPAAVLALAIAAVAIGAFLFGEWVERRVAGAAAPDSPARPKRFVFGALAGAGLLAVVTLALPQGAGAAQRPVGRIGPEELARRAFERPWSVRILDLRGEPCRAERVPGAECVDAAELPKLGLEAEPPARDLVIVGAGDLPGPPPGAAAFPGRLLLLEGGWPGWKGWSERAGVKAAPAAPAASTPAPAAGGGGAPRKKKGGGGGCG